MSAGGLVQRWIWVRPYKAERDALLISCFDDMYSLAWCEEGGRHEPWLIKMIWVFDE